jgi:large subunit ribosomal protein L21
MYAVIRTGGKQYKVAPDDTIRVEKLAGAAGDTVKLTDILMVGGEGEPMIGAPLVDGAVVTAELVGQTRAAKIKVFKKKRRKNYRRTAGHRQDLTILRITEIAAGGRKSAAKAERQAEPRKAEPETAEAEAAAPKAAETKKAEPKAAEPKKAEPKTAEPKKAAAKKVEAAPLFTAPDGAPDDLKKISGVGPVLEKKLHALGITRFDQIAAFSADDIAKVDEELNFKGRIEREDWIAQAKALAEEASS